MHFLKQFFTKHLERYKIIWQCPISVINLHEKLNDAKIMLTTHRV